MKALAIVLFVTGCQPGDMPSESPSPGVFFPQHRLTAQQGLPAGDLVAVLRLMDGCLMLRTEGRTYLALWPSTYALTADDAMAVHDEGGVTVARTGQQIHVSGGVYPDAQRPFVEDLIGGPIPADCVAEGYWLVGEVLDD